MLGRDIEFGLTWVTAEISRTGTHPAKVARQSRGGRRAERAQDHGLQEFPGVEVVRGGQGPAGPDSMQAMGVVG